MAQKRRECLCACVCVCMRMCGGEGRGVSDWVLRSGPETQSGKVNHYLCLTPLTHMHTR